MMTLNGKYGTANVYASVVDNSAISQIIELLNQPFIADSHIAIMPDVHAGAGCVIGTTMTLRDKVVPNLVGVDIGCGMETVKLEEKELDFAELDKAIHENIPSGFNIRTSPHKYVKDIDLEELHCCKSVNIARALNSIGTLGGGNHFIEVDRDDDGNLYLIIHSGSRHLGLETAKYYQNEAYTRLAKPDRKVIAKITAELKAQNRQWEIQSALREYMEKIPKIPNELAYCEGELFEHYIHDMRIVQRFAVLNRKAMVDEIMGALDLHAEEQFTTIHNYIDTENMILRKGSVSAQKGEKLLIPINMRDGSLICVGKGNPDYNYSAPHGAGRLFSRSEAKENFTVDDYAREMQGIYTTSVNRATLDECPMAYKSIDDIVSNLDDTVEIVSRIKPVYNFKAGEE
ncbi:MAG: RtcB family protein [Oscillospiraceae bacterium]|nr:RtcB family protein [Oscillospiraceae bacterium]